MKAPSFIGSLTWKSFLLVLVLLSSTLYIGSCIREGAKPKDSVQISLDYNKFILEAEVNTEGYRGPVAARAYGYIGLAAYEAGLPGFNGEFISMNTMYPMIQLPARPDAMHFNLPVALNACYNTILQQFFMSAPENIRQHQLEIYTRWVEQLSYRMDTVTYHVSAEFGKAVAKAIYDWSETDTIGDKGNHHNYDRTYKRPEGDGLWTASLDFPMPPLLPSWGKVRPFVIRTEDYLAKPLPAYSTAANSFYHTQAMELVTLTKQITAENQWIASFWNDDRPGLTFSPAGHWLAITNQVIEKENPSIEKTLETYLKVGFSLSDAMVSCWNAKYLYNRERPESFIKRNIEKDWRPVSPSPSFPSYPSGHSIMGAAAAEVLTDLYGASYTLMDCSHQDLQDFQVEPRTYTSFDAMAKENALSRMLLGVHWRMDCEEGLRLGELIGAEVSGIQVERRLTQ